MVIGEIPLNAALIGELRAMARQGKATRQLVDRIRKDFADGNAVIPILGHLRRAFFVPLPALLPLREDMGNGAYGRAMQLPFWFAGLLTQDVSYEPWNWDRFWSKFGGTFSAECLAKVFVPGGYIASAQPPAAPGDIYARAFFEAYLDTTGVFGPDDAQIYRQIRDLAKTFHAALTPAPPAPPARAGEALPMPMKFEYQIEEQGPKFHVVCMAHAFREAGVSLAETASTAI